MSESAYMRNLKAKKNRKGKKTGAQAYTTIEQQ